jgi:hypothetical protein
MRYGERAVVNNTKWLVIGRYLDASDQQATANAASPRAVWVAL